jgi:uncharacterized protein (DUF2267 family)
VDGWHLGEKKKIKDKDDFIEILLLQNPRTAVHDFRSDNIAIQNTKAVFRVLRRHVSEGEIQDVIAQFPVGLKDLWEEEVASNP